MKKGGGQATLGFTIVETLIVLAVTGILFASVATMLSGRQGKTQFSQATGAISTQISQIINEVSQGYYPNVANTSCNATGGSIHFGGGGVQGQNKGCVFLGKVVQFGVAGTDPEQFISYSLAGCQHANCAAAGTDEASTLNEAEPTVIPSSSETNILQFGLSVKWMKYDGHNTRGVGFLQSLGSYSGCTGLCSGSSQAALYGINDGDTGPNGTNLSSADMIAKLNGGNGANIIPASQVQICFESGTTPQSALATIGGNGRQLSVTLDIKNGVNC